jgi:hypothetical protein
MAEVTFDMRKILIEFQETLHSHRSIPRSLDPWLQRALYLEDSLGYVLPIPLETISSWEVSTIRPFIGFSVANKATRRFIWCFAINSLTVQDMN